MQQGFSPKLTQEEPDEGEYFFDMGYIKKNLQDPKKVEIAERLSGLSKEQFLKKLEYYDHLAVQATKEYRKRPNLSTVRREGDTLVTELCKEIPGLREAFRLSLIVNKYTNMPIDKINPADVDNDLQVLNGICPETNHVNEPLPMSTQSAYKASPTKSAMNPEALGTMNTQWGPKPTQQAPLYQPAAGNLQYNGEHMIRQATKVLRKIHEDSVNNNGKVSPNIELTLKGEIDTLEQYVKQYEEVLRERRHLQGKTMCFQNVIGFQEYIYDVVREIAELAKKLMMAGKNCKSIMS